MRIKVGNKEFDVVVASTPEESNIGLSNTTELKKGTGFVMMFSGETNIPITMEDMSYSLDIVFSLNNVVTYVNRAKPGDTDIRSIKNSDLILEINSGSSNGIKVGDEIKLVGRKNEDGTVTPVEGGIPKDGISHVLDEDGKNQMNLKGGERIFSRGATKRMYELANKKEFKKLGKLAVDEIIKQDSAKTEYSKN